MVEGFGEASKLAAYATPEVRDLFQEWAGGIEEQVLDFVRGRGAVAPEEIAAHLNISTDSAVFFVARLAHDGRLRIGAVETAPGA
ncbi:MAG: hypothetical protein ACE5MB_05220 [Anaerolineae bacterium]